jgi:hypothetical protein
MSGVVTFLTAKDIPGTNDYFMDLFIPGMGKPEPVKLIIRFSTIYLFY